MNEEKENRAADCVIGCMFILSILLAVVLAFAGCTSPRVVTVTEYKERVVQVRVRDTTILTQADSASARALLHCDSAYNIVVDELATLQGSRIKADVQVAHLMNETSKTQPTASLLITCKEDSLITVIHMQDSIISDLTQQTKTIETPRGRSGYDKFCSWFFWIVIVVLFLLGAFILCDKIPACKPYTAVIKGLFKFL